MIQGIQTCYRGINFRSRLEAKWARFFDLCGWSWSYEPFDLAGWIPDFVLGWNRTAVEVKPYFSAGEFSQVIEKIRCSGYEDDVVLLPADPLLLNDDEKKYEFDPPILGFLNEYWETDGKREIAQVAGVTEGTVRKDLRSGGRKPQRKQHKSSPDAQKITRPLSDMPGHEVFGGSMEQRDLASSTIFSRMHPPQQVGESLESDMGHPEGFRPNRRDAGILDSGPQRYSMEKTMNGNKAVDHKQRGADSCHESAPDDRKDKNRNGS